MLQQDVEFNYASSSLSYMTGPAAVALGLAQNSPNSCTGYPGCAYDLNPGEIVTSASQWMNTFIKDNPNDPFYSFQSVWDPKSALPPGEQAALEAWAQGTGERSSVFCGDASDGSRTFDLGDGACRFRGVRLRAILA